MIRSCCSLTENETKALLEIGLSFLNVQLAAASTLLMSPLVCENSYAALVQEKAFLAELCCNDPYFFEIRTFPWLDVAWHCEVPCAPLAVHALQLDATSGRGDEALHC